MSACARDAPCGIHIHGRDAVLGDLTYTDATFVAEAHAWLKEACRSAGIAITADVEQIHVRPWSTVFRAPTTSGAVYLKCCGPTQRHEPQLTALLHREFRGLVPELLALHPMHPWMLVGEGGRKLRDVFAGDDVLAAWRKILPSYAQLQRDVTRHTQAILASGTPDHRGTRLVSGLEEVAANEPVVSDGRADALTGDERKALLRTRSRLLDGLRDLATLGIADTLQHDDLHDGNVLVRDGRTVIFDWGDACVSHPFLTLTVTLRVAAFRSGRAEDSAEIHALRDAYLEPWSESRTLQELRGGAELARRIGEVSRTLTWYRVARMYPTAVDEYPGGLAGSLRRVMKLLS